MERKSIFDILRLLEERKVSFTLNRSRPDSIRVDATLYGLRLEIECFDDNRLEISTFKGDEDIDGGLEYLLKTLEDNRLE